jgi:hypothetical protein
MRKSDERLRRNLLEIERQIAREKGEIGHVLSKSGKHFPKLTRSGEDSILFPDGHSRKIYRKILTHNHPWEEHRETNGVKESIFSGSDLQFAYSYKMAEIRLAFSNERHSFKWRPSFRFFSKQRIKHMVVICSVRVFEAAYMKAEEQLRHEYSASTAVGNSQDWSMRFYTLYLKYIKKIATFLSENQQEYNYNYSCQYDPPPRIV